MFKVDNLEYNEVFRYFKEICSIPHGSGNTQKISNYCVDFAKKHDLWYMQDVLGNVIIKKTASAGYENHPPVILQGHLDMVCEKAEDHDIDFATDSLQVDREGDYIFAHGTSLGGDDGIAVAMAMAILADKTLSHPPLEVVFTVDEETGMFGAQGLDMSCLAGKTLINIDSEEEGVFTVSCAGGARAELVLPLQREENTMPCYKVTVYGLQGGHSGVEIDKGRLNANTLLGKFIKELKNCCIVQISGGMKDNAIPTCAEVILAINEDIRAQALHFEKQNRCNADPGLTLSVEPVAQYSHCFTEASSVKIADFLCTVPNGIITMSKDISGLVQTSLNLGILKTAEEGISASFAVRSSKTSEKTELLQQLERTALKYGGKCDLSAFYPAWEYRKVSRLRETMCDVWERLFDKPARVVAIHAGLECGLFCEKILDLDAVSIGPNMMDIHTCRERLSISSVQRVYRFLLELLKQL